ncbi:MeaB protein [Nannizzia gypsea CBS 118893]|uniref:MeaB protein n=1 Tax=Arthroderma gypseum (strain ATCC MYA-4604 / CBS 118893) TaxID=535722 RepID=E5QYZ8_ARTGP|nr:MeaB protein [Nannizzia gypsea CBS 118893]EFQ98121.1 MeaB protein [Nannizzia gypsea CBS 118893]
MDEITTKSEPNHTVEGSCSSSLSTPEPEGEVVVQDPVQRQKRKGGRKPIYATSEERKQRNRQAQAAFRERRTEYIKQLETTIKHNEEALHSLQQSHRNAADECLMLRYKNSLLERILLEKGVDVQAELRLRGGSPNLPPNRLPTSQPSHSPSLAQTSPGPATHLPKLEPIPVSQVHREGGYIMHSPQLQTTPSSHVSSPVATKSTAFGLQGGISPTAADIQHQHQHQQQYKPHPYHRTQIPPQSGGFGPGLTSAATESIEPTPILPSRIPPTYYLSSFQKQYNQLGKSGHPDFYFLFCVSTPEHYFADTGCAEQEYDARSSSVDGPDPPEGSTAADYTSQQSLPRIQQRHNPISTSSDAEGMTASTSYIEQFDPMMDPDPFGLSASMHFPTPFTYGQGHGRQ